MNMERGMWMMRLLLALWVLVSGSAMANCTSTAASPAAFGGISSMSLQTVVQATSSRNAGLRCSGNVTAADPWLGGAGYFKVELGNAVIGLTGPHGDVVAYRVNVGAQRDSMNQLQGGVSLDLAKLGIIDALRVLGDGADGRIPLYLETGTGNVTAGRYTDTLMLNWSWDYCVTDDGHGVCTARDASSATTLLQVTLDVQNDCTMTAAGLSFGSAPVPMGFGAVNQSISVTCTKGSAYSVGLGNGNHFDAGKRRMASDKGAYLAYEVFKSGSAMRWGSSGAERRSSLEADVNPGNGLGTGRQMFRYNARVTADQPAVPAGTYTDTLMIDVIF